MKNDLSTLLLEARMETCLAAIEAIARADDLSPHERDLRLTQLASCASGAPCPELAFDPTAIQLGLIAEALRLSAGARRAWRLRVAQAISGSRSSESAHASAA